MEHKELLEPTKRSVQSFFDVIGKKGCSDPCTFLGNRVMYHTIKNKEADLMLSSTYSILLVENEDGVCVPIRGWSLIIVKISIAEPLRRQGLGTNLLKFILENTPTHFVVVQCANEHMESLLLKNAGELNPCKGAYGSTDWVLEKYQ